MFTRFPRKKGNISKPFLDYLQLKLNDKTYVLKDRERINVSLNDYLTVEGVKNNIDKESEIIIRINDNPVKRGNAKRIRDIIDPNIDTLKIDLTRKDLLVGEIYINTGRIRQLILEL